jgi:hypothetical protein
VLALDLVHSWSFERPSIVRERPLNGSASSELPLSPRRLTFSLQSAIRRRNSILIDMDIPSEPPTRHASPERGMPPTIPEDSEPVAKEGDLFARKAGLGSLMKSAKQDVKVPEFDLSAFSF